MAGAVKWAALASVGLVSSWAAAIHALSLIEALKLASFLATVVLSFGKKGQVFTVFAVLGWLLRTGHTAHMALLWQDMPDKWQPLLTGGKGHVTLLLTTVYDQALVLSTLPTWLADMLCVLHAIIFGCLVNRYLDANVHWWHRMGLCVLMPQICVMLPCLARRRWAAYASSKRASAKQQALNSELSSFSSGSMESAATPSKTTPAPPQKAVSKDIFASAAMLKDLAWGRKQATAGMPPTAGAGVQMVKALRACPYKRKLAKSHQVCLKLDCDVWYDQLPYDSLSKDMLKALQDMRAANVHITTLAARPGCVMITMTLQPGHRHDDSHDKGHQASPSMLADAVLQPVLHMFMAAPAAEAAAAGGVAAAPAGVSDATAMVRKVRVQVDDYLAVAHPMQENSSNWQLQQVQAEVAAQHAKVELSTDGVQTASSSTGSTDCRLRLGVTCLVGAAQPLPTARGLKQVFEVQMWGVSKADVVIGWTAPEPGQHSNPSTAQHANKSQSWAAPVGSERETPCEMFADFMLLARLPSGGYSHTCVIGTRREPGSSCTIVQVEVELPWHLLLQHHAGATHNSLLLLNFELCTSQEVLMSSTPVVAILSSRLDHGMVPSTLSAWWWGASGAAIQAAVADVQACCTALMEAGVDAASVIPAWVEFLGDVQLWLLEVQRVAVKYGLCSCSSIAMHAAMASMMSQPSLDDDSRQQLWEGLLEYANVMSLEGVHSMLQQQMQQVILAAKRLQVQQYSTAANSTSVNGSSSGSSSSSTNGGGSSSSGNGGGGGGGGGGGNSCITWAHTAKAWRLVQQVLSGHECSQCEAYYKQQLHRLLSPACQASSVVLAACALYVCIKFAHVEEILTWLLVLPWGMLHIAPVVAAYLRSSRKPADNCADLKLTRWAVYAYVWRLGARAVRGFMGWRSVQLDKLYSRPSAWMQYILLCV